jgi:hypothetical protein
MEDAMHFGYPVLFKATWSAGLEQHLIAIAGDAESAPHHRRMAVQGLGTADSAGARDTLLELAHAAEDDKLLFLECVVSLSWLGDERGVAVVEPRLFDPAWDRVNFGLVAALGGLGGPEAVRVLTRYLEHDRARHLVPALESLRRLDPGAAKRAAARLLDGPRAAFLAADDLRSIAAVAGR